MLTKEQKIKLILDIKKGKISNQILHFTDKEVVFADPYEYTISDIQFTKDEYQRTINYLRSLNIQIIEFVSVAGMTREEIKAMKSRES